MERPVHVELFEPGWKDAFSIDAGIRIHGNATRAYSQKSLRLIFRKQYGERLLKYPVFPNDTVSKFKTLILRNSGNDWTKTLMRDAVIQSLLRKCTGLEVTAYRPIIVFINGEYWGIHQLCERLDEDHFVNKYNIAKDSLLIIESGGKLFFGEKGDEKLFARLLQDVKSKDLSQADNYNEVSSQMDIGNFIDYMIAELYFANSDWPNNNVSCWRYKTDSASSGLNVRDGRWRWMIHDLDYALGYGNDASYDMFARLKNDRVVGAIFFSLLNNKEFRARLEERTKALLGGGLSPAAIDKEISLKQHQLASEIPRQVDRWRVPASLDEWYSNISDMRGFASGRPAIFLQQLGDILYTYRKKGG